MRKNETAKTRMVVRERESKEVKKSCSFFDAQKCAVVEKNESVNNWGVKLNNIKLGYMEMATSFLGIAEPFAQRKCN